MMKEEFENLIGKTISKNEYDIIEFVYMWHPAINDVNGKQQMADIYKQYGMSLIRNMKEPASIMQLILSEEEKVNRKKENLRERKVRVINGDLEYERCRKEMKAIFASASVKEGAVLLSAVSEKYGEALYKKVKAELCY